MSWDVPPSKNHRQLAAVINAAAPTFEGRRVEAQVRVWTTNTDRHPKGVRWRIPGKGRKGLLLEIYYLGGYADVDRVYRHESGETYCRHREAREWCARNLTPTVKR